jgi:hypothetical protein
MAADDLDEFQDQPAYGADAYVPRPAPAQPRKPRDIAHDAIAECRRLLDASRVPAWNGTVKPRVKEEKPPHELIAVTALVIGDWAWVGDEGKEGWRRVADLLPDSEPGTVAVVWEGAEADGPQLLDAATTMYVAR